MSKISVKSALRMLESGFLTLGVILLATFVFLRAWGGHQSQSDIQAFEEAVAAGSAPSTQQPESDGDFASEPDYTLWSSKRISDYHASNAQRDDPPLAILSIDELDLKVPVYNGTDEINLNRGAGRIIGTARIDAPGNLGIAAHRDGFFRVLKDVELGDTLELQTHLGEKEFVVSSITIVDPSDVSVLAPTDEPTITLVTCYPFYFVGHAPKRYIVKAELLSEQVNKS
ncbi:MAG: class D sortase [Xanthomonadales bacterium]|nr:class D sortase [Gammaproteobacteria bacterium]MBT8072865.1 class D sortase [Gammaproteobacteria bacterium]NNK03706.1 class D sortase [Xanthomonadales bacterium]NNK98351.1 class D sortase [Xanthomonadales bacterium]